MKCKASTPPKAPPPEFRTPFTFQARLTAVEAVWIGEVLEFLQSEDPLEQVVARGIREGVFSVSRGKFYDFSGKRQRTGVRIHAIESQGN